MKNLIINSESLTDFLNIEHFISETTEEFKLLLELMIEEQVSIYGDERFHRDNCFLKNKIENIITEIARSNINMDLKRVFLSTFSKILRVDDILYKFTDEKLTINGEKIEIDSADAISYFNGIHQFIFKDSNLQKQVIICNSSKKESKIYRVHSRWSFNVFSEILRDNDKIDFIRVFRKIGFLMLSPSLKFSGFDSLDPLSQKRVLELFYTHGPELSIKGGCSLGTRFIQPATEVRKGLRSFEYRIKVNRNQYRIYFIVIEGLTCLLLDSFKKTRSISSEIESQIAKSYEITKKSMVSERKAKL